MSCATGAFRLAVAIDPSYPSRGEEFAAKTAAADRILGSLRQADATRTLLRTIRQRSPEDLIAGVAYAQANLAAAMSSTAMPSDLNTVVRPEGGFGLDPANNSPTSA